MIPRFLLSARLLLWVITFTAGVTIAQTPQGLPQPVIPQPFGVNIHFVNPDAAEVDALAAVGYRFARMDFGWGGIERKSGEYNFSGYDKLVEAMSQRQIRLLFIFDYANRLYDDGVAPHTPEGRAAFARFAAAAAKHFAGKGIIWEIWNEPNIVQFWKPRPSAVDYADLAVETIKAVRQADPQAYIIGPASSEFPWEFFQVLAQRGVLSQFDAISVHPYRQKAPETAQADYQRLRLLLDRASPNKRLAIISGEWGYSTGWKNLSEELQSQYIARQWLVNLASDVHLSIWYDWKDDGADPKEPEHHFGSVYRDLKLKPAAQAAKTLIGTLRDYRYVRRIQMPDANDYVLVFQKDQKLALAAWTSGEVHSVQLALPAGAVQVVDLLGQKKQATANAQGLAIRLGPAAQYLLPQGNDRELALLGCWGLPASTVSVSTTKAAMITVNIANPTDQPLAAQVQLDVDGRLMSKRTVNLAPKASAQTVTLPVSLTGYSRQSLTGIIRFQVGDKPGSALQQSLATLLVTSSVTASVLPPVNGDVTVLVENASGQALRGDVRAACGPEAVSAAFDLAAGKTQATVRLHLTKFTPDAVVEVTGTTSGGLPLFPGKMVLWRNIPLSHATEVCKTWVEGDAKVSGQVTVQPAKLPDPAPQAGLSGALQVDYRFAQGWRYAVVSPIPSAAAIEGKPHRLGMWILGDGSGNVVRCRIKDSGGQTFQSTLTSLDFTGWRWVTTPIDGKDAYFFGGANDGVMHYPIRLDALALIDSVKNVVDRDLRVFLAGVALEY